MFNLNAHNYTHYLLPPANEVCEGYVFTSVCHSVHGGACVVAPGGACMVAPRGGMRGCSGGGHVWLLRGGMHGFWGGVHGFLWGGMHGFFDEQVVRILLECILVQDHLTSNCMFFIFLDVGNLFPLAEYNRRDLDTKYLIGISLFQQI